MTRGKLYACLLVLSLNLLGTVLASPVANDKTFDPAAYAGHAIEGVNGLFALNIQPRKDEYVPSESDGAERPSEEVGGEEIPDEDEDDDDDDDDDDWWDDDSPEGDGGQEMNPGGGEGQAPSAGDNQGQDPSIEDDTDSDGEEEEDYDQWWNDDNDADDRTNTDLTPLRQFFSRSYDNYPAEIEEDYCERWMDDMEAAFEEAGAMATAARKAMDDLREPRPEKTENGDNWPFEEWERKSNALHFVAAIDVSLTGGPYYGFKEAFEAYYAVYRNVENAVKRTPGHLPPPFAMACSKPKKQKCKGKDKSKCNGKRWDDADLIPGGPDITARMENRDYLIDGGLINTSSLDYSDRALGFHHLVNITRLDRRAEAGGIEWTRATADAPQVWHLDDVDATPREPLQSCGWPFVDMFVRKSSTGGYVGVCNYGLPYQNNLLPVEYGREDSMSNAKKFYTKSHLWFNTITILAGDPFGRPIPEQPKVDAKFRHVCDNCCLRRHVKIPTCCEECPTSRYQPAQLWDEVVLLAKWNPGLPVANVDSYTTFAKAMFLDLQDWTKKLHKASDA